MAHTRIQVHKQKVANSIKVAKRQIADLLRQQKEESARIKVENTIREDYLLESFDLLELFCDMLQNRMQLLEESTVCPHDLKEAVVTLVWATPRIEIPEFLEIRKQIGAKYGQQFVDAAMENRDLAVNQRVMFKLGVKVPEPYLCVQYMKEIAREFNVEWDERNSLASVDIQVPTMDFVNPGPGGMPPGGNVTSPPSYDNLHPPTLQRPVYDNPPDFRTLPPSYDNLQPPNLSSQFVQQPPPPNFHAPNQQQQQQQQDSFAFADPRAGGVPLNQQRPSQQQPQQPLQQTQQPPAPSQSDNFDDLAARFKALSEQGPPSFDDLGPAPGSGGNLSSPPPATTPNNLFMSQGTYPSVDPLGSVPPLNQNVNQSSGDVDFDDLQARFEALKKKN